MKPTLALGATLLLACSAGSPPPAEAELGRASAAPTPSAAATSSAAPAPATPAQPPLHARLDGQDAAFRGFIAKAYGDNELELGFARQALDCGSSRKAYDAQVTLDRVVLPSGERQWIVRQASYVNGIKSADYGAATVAGDPSGTLSVVLPKIVIDSSKEPKLFELWGGLVAKGCGDVAKNPAQPRPQAGAKLRLAGQELPVRGAILKREPSGDELVVSTSALDCSGQIVEGEDLQVRVQRGKAEAYVSLRGALNGTHTSMTLHKKEQLPELQVGPVKGGVAPVTVELSLERAPRLELSGAVDALVCTEG